MEIRARHWLVAISAAALVHLAVVAGMREAPRPPPPTPMVIQLGAVGAPEGASGGGSAAAAEPVGALLAPVAAAPPLPALAAIAPVKAQVVEPPPPKVVTPKPKVQPKPKPKPKPKQIEKPKPRVQAARPSRPSTISNSRAQSQHRPSHAGASKRPANTHSDGSGQGRGKHGSGRAAGGSSSGQGAGLGAKGTANYYGKLAVWLNRHKRYPSRARRLRQEGTVKVSFTINRSGRVLSHRIVSSSGHALLDQEVEAMLKRASPLPSFPPGMSQSQLTITVPIRFSLR